MRWSSVVVVACVLVATAAHQSGNQPNCQFSATHTCTAKRLGVYSLDGHQVTIKSNQDKLLIKCDGWQALDFEALPRFENEVHVPTVKLLKCPLPSTRSIADVLSALNVKFSSDNDTNLLLLDTPSSPPVSSAPFVGLDYLTGLEISLSRKQSTANFFSGLISLRSLKLTSISLPAGNSATGELLELPDTLEKLQIFEWNVKELAPLGRCKGLLQLDLYRPSVEVLPERWVAACPNLQKITLKSSTDPISLPPKFLEGANELKRLRIMRCLKSIPEGILEGASGLIALDLSHNNLQTLSSETFRGTNLITLSLAYNSLSSESLEALSSLTTLIKLDLSHNRNIKNPCDENGYSRLKDLFLLKELSLQDTGVTKICRDWREDLVLLESLDLTDTSIEELKLADLEFTRADSINNAEVVLYDALVTSVIFTEDDYNKAATSPVPNAQVRLRWGSFDELECNCQMYWTRKVMDIPKYNSYIPLNDLKCKDGISLKYKSVDQICPELASA